MPASSALWNPSSRLVADSRMTAFQNFCSKLSGSEFRNYDSLYQWSVTDIDGFWAAAQSFLEINWAVKPSNVIREQRGTTMMNATWFPDARLNFAENLLPKPSQSEVMVAYAEGREARRYSAEQLWAAVAGCAKGLRESGVLPGDRVAGVLSNGPEAVIAMLATAACGGVWSSCSPDFGTAGIFDRLSQVTPRVVFLTGQYFYNGKRVECLKAALDAINKMTPKPTVVVVDHLDGNADQFQKFCQSERSSPQLSFEPRAFGDPQYILFSSGTTGLPKPITHSVGGTLLQHKKELILHSDLKSGDTLFFFTTCGWMMWNWMVSALACDAKIVLFDGSPTHAGLDTLWELCRTENVTHFGTSPKFLSTCMADPQFSPVRKSPMPYLRTMLCTGSPLLPQHFSWVYNAFPDIHLASISGGTDIVSCFMLGNPNLPVYSGEIQCRGLGMAVEAWDDNGQNVVGKKAELVCTKPFVSMPVGFWNDHDRTRYRRAYFEHYQSGRGFSDVWRHGDFIEITESGGIVVYGRSDATLNPGGVRIGTAEIYRVVETLSFVADSVAVGQIRGDDTRVVLFVKLAAGCEWSSTYEQEIRGRIRRELTPRHIPAVILPVLDIPYTRSGKKMEVAVTQVVHGETVPNMAAIANPDSLNYFRIWSQRLQEA